MSLSRIEELLEMINNKSGPTDMIPLSRTEEILKCYINGISYTGPITSRFEELLYNTLYKQPSDEQPLSRSEEILKSKIDKTTYEGAILSRVEGLLLELKTEPDPVEITIGPDTILHVLNAIEAAAVSLKIDLTPTQDGTPWISDTLNTEPYLSRAAQNGNTADETIVGGTVCFNQLVTFQTGSSTSHDVTFERKADGSVVVNGTATGSAYANLGDTMYGVNGHKILIIGCPSGGSASTYYLRDGYTAGKYDKGSGLIIAKTADRMVPQIGVALGTTMSNAVFKPQFFDLTQMFGSAIADYAYSLETSEAGSGIAWLHSHGFIDDNYHAYNTGELISAKPTAKIVGDTTYALGGADLRGLFKLDANNNLYCDGDVYTSDGTITRKYGIVDLGTLNWLYSTSYDNPAFYCVLNDRKSLDSNAEALCPLYTYSGTFANLKEFANNSGNKTIGFIAATIKQIYIRDDSYTDKNALKTALSGVYLVYELETPTTEQSTAYTNPQKAGEAESFVDARTEKVPVGHSTRYSAEYAINGFEGVTVHVSETQTGGTTYPVTFTSQGTVYGGTIDVVSGEMTITWAIADMGDLEWTQPSTGYFEAYFNAYNTGHEIFGLLTTSYPKDNGTNMIYYARITARGTNQRGIAVGDIRYNDITAFKTAVTGQKVAYELSTPITATIDQTTINISEGESYVWAEEGNSTLTYMGIPVTRKRSK